MAISPGVGGYDDAVQLRGEVWWELPGSGILTNPGIFRKWARMDLFLAVADRLVF